MTRQEAIEILKANYPDKCYELLREAVDTAIKSLEDEAKHGRWIKRGDNSWECSVCHEISCCNGSYCVDCGTKMDAPKNAHWIKQLNGEYKCSVCGDTTLAPLYECGTCGTKMDGVEE